MAQYHSLKTTPEPPRSYLLSRREPPLCPSAATVQTSCCNLPDTLPDSSDSVIELRFAQPPEVTSGSSSH